MMFYLQSAMFMWNSKNTNKVTKPTMQSIVSYLDDGILLNIFARLQVVDLLRAGAVCRQWNRVSKDFTLWGSLQLSPLGQKLSEENTIQNFFKMYPISRLVALDLSGLTVSQKTLSLIAKSCKKLRKLVLKSVTVESNEKDPMFPGFLEHLDLKHSNAVCAEFYLLVSYHLTSVQWLGICDGFIYALFMEGRLEAAFQSMQKLRWLDTSHCLLAKDSLVSMVSSCKQLEILCMRKCLCVRGTTLSELLGNCTNLKGLILDGTSISDDVLNSLPWERKAIEYLELACCPFVDTECLRKLVKRLAYSKSLGYLGLGSIGDGKCVNDEILDQIAVLSSKGLYPNLTTLNVTSSKVITMKGLRSMMKQCGANIDIITNNCPAIDGNLSIDENNNILANRKCKSHFRSKRLRKMKQFDLESPL